MTHAPYSVGGVRPIGRARQGSPSFSALLTSRAYKMATEQLESLRPTPIESWGSQLDPSLFLSRSRAVEGGWSVGPASIRRRVVARRAPLDRHQPPAPCRPFSACLSSQAHERAIYGTADPCSFQTDDTRLQGGPDAATAAYPSRRALYQVEAQQRRTRCVPLPCLCPLLWLALASRIVPKSTHALWAFSWMA